MDTSFVGQNQNVPSQPVHVERSPTEIPLLLLVVMAAAGIWILLAVSIIGIVYALLIACFLFVTHLTFVVHVRGSAVRLGPDQLPELYQRVQELAARAGLKKMPEAYVMQAGGALNALATKFLRSEMVVLFSDLLEACGENKSARDMIIGHELGHIKSGHLRWLWLIAPGFFIPFLGSAYSRARELTCDRYGAVLCGDRPGALAGLAILAAGGRHGPQINLQALANQRVNLDTGWMTLGKWLSTYPPLCDRVAALEPALRGGSGFSFRGPLRALAILGIVLLVPTVLMTIFVAKFLSEFQKALQNPRTRAELHRPSPATKNTEAARSQVGADFAALASVARETRRTTGKLPADYESLCGSWIRLRSDQPIPLDPFDGTSYGYYAGKEYFVLTSVGPDGEPDSDDDIVFDSRRSS